MSAPPPASPDPWRPPGLAALRPGLAELLLQVAATSVTERDAEALLREVCARLTPLCGLTGCAAVLFDGSTGSVRTVVASHPEAEQLTRLVQQLGLGLNAAAIQAGQDTVVEDLTESVRAGLAEAAQRVGLPVTAGLALRGGEDVVGCLQLYSHTLNTVAGGLLDELAPLATVLGAVLGNLEVYHHSAALVASLTTALDRQRPIEQAKGMLAERHGVDLDAAYRMLREQAHRRSTTVVAVAAEVVNQSWRAPDDPPTDPPVDPTSWPPVRTSEPTKPHPVEPAPGHPPAADTPSGEPEQGALLDIGAVPARPAPPTRTQPKRAASVDQPTRPEQTSLLDLAAVPEQAAKPDRNGAEVHPDQTPLPEQRGGPTQVEPHPTA